MAASTAPSPKPNNVSYSMELVLHNSDLVREILEWLPAKSLVKFQSVSREWLSLISPLISSAEFRQQHTLRCLKVQQSLILQTDNHRHRRQSYHLNPTSRRSMPYSLSLPDDDDNEHVILHSSNGLLLLLPKYYLKRKNYYLYVHNPATKQSRKIMIPRSSTHPYVADAALAFDPSKSPYYELVCIRHSQDPTTHRIEVYSSESHTWKEPTLEPFILKGCSIKYFSTVYCNNAVYWSSKIGPFYCGFDLAKREWKTLPCPPPLHLKNDGYRRLQESNGHLFHVEWMVFEGGRETVAVWEFDDDDDHKWLLRHRRELPPPPPQLLWCVRPSILTFLVDTCSLLICRQNGWTRVFSLNLGSFDNFLDATGKPFPNANCDKYLCFSAFEFGGTLALV